MTKTILTSLILLAVILYPYTAQSQQVEPAKPKAGRYVQIEKKETIWRIGEYSSGLGIRVRSVDILKDGKTMRVNFILWNTSERPNHISKKHIPIFYIVDENATKYHQLKEPKIQWEAQGKNNYALAPTEKVKGSVLFPLMEEGARSFDFYLGTNSHPVKNIQLLE